MKESKKDTLQPPTTELGPKPEANGEVLAEAAVLEKPEVELSNLVTCSKLAQSQASLRSASSVGSVRGDEGGAYSEFFGDYAPLFDNRQDPDNISLQGWCRRRLASGRRLRGGDMEGGQGSASGCPCRWAGDMGVPGLGGQWRDSAWDLLVHPPTLHPESCSLGGRARNGSCHQFTLPDWWGMHGGPALRHEAGGHRHSQW